MSIPHEGQVAAVHTAYTEVLATLIFALVEQGALQPALAGEVVRRGKTMLATFPLEDCDVIEKAYSGLERLAQQVEQAGPRD